MGRGFSASDVRVSCTLSGAEPGQQGCPACSHRQSARNKGLEVNFYSVSQNPSSPRNLLQHIRRELGIMVMLLSVARGEVDRAAGLPRTAHPLCMPWLLQPRAWGPEALELSSSCAPPPPPCPPGPTDTRAVARCLSMQTLGNVLCV